MSVHIRIPLDDRQKRILEDAKKGIHAGWSQFDNDFDWEGYYQKVDELKNPFEDAFILWCAYQRDAGFQFWTSPLRYQFHSVEDYLAQASEYRRRHNLKPIEQLTEQDAMDYQEWYQNEKNKIRNEFLGRKN